MPLPSTSDASPARQFPLYSAYTQPWASPEEMEHEISGVRGNTSEEAKRRAVAIFRFFVREISKTEGQSESFGADVGKRIKMVGLDVWDYKGKALQGQGHADKRAVTARTIFEITVTKDMCNVYGILHGACAAYIVDPCSVSALVALGDATGIDGTGVSQSMNLIWHQLARVGTTLRVVSTSMSIKGRVRTSRCELWDSKKDLLCVSAVHSTVNPGQSFEAGSKPKDKESKL